VTADEHVHAPQLWEVVAERIRSSILSGELRPGAKLVERDLAERYGTSRGPIRDAFRELAREGLVVELPRRRTIVSTLTARDLIEVYTVREALDVGAAKVLVATAADAELERLDPHLEAFEAAWKAGEGYLAAATHDLAFHRELVGLTRNERLIAIYEQMLATTGLLLRTAAETSPGLREGMERWVHRDIVDALAARDADAARVAIEAHYRHAGERIFLGLDASPGA
jgi:DNA-binding GntR family transcriptional regulator